ncbi:MAG: HEAT repeat domain-containing protein [Planctomycetes bacterium]|nr:HEAT repeat domain-containing protein [Planctomycetota bacterium]
MIQNRFFRSSVFLCLALLAPLAAGDAQSASADAQRQVAALVDEFKHEVTQRAVDDAHAKELLERLAAQFAVAGTRERGVIVRGLEKGLSAKEKGQPDSDVVCLTARALAAMAPESLPALERAAENRSLLKDKEIGRTLVLALGKTRDKSVVKTLLDFLDSSDDGLVAAACEALGEYDSAPLVLRKQLFGEVLKSLMEAKDQKESQAQPTLDPNAVHDDAAQRRYDAIQAACGTTLERLSKQDSREADLWQRWWNKNKRADWDDKSKLS